MEDLVIIKESFLVVLDSRNADAYFNSTWNSSVNFEFEDPILKEDNYTIQMSCSVLNFSVANSIYNINETNSFLSLSDGTAYNLYIPYGTYNFITLNNTIKNLGIGNITMSLNSITNKISFTHPTNTITINNNSTILLILGGILNQTYTGQTINMPYQCNFNGVNNINIYLENVNTRNVDSFQKANCSLIQSIQVNPYSSQIIFNKTNDYSCTIKQNNMNYLQVDIKDDLNRYINFNNQSWNLTLCFSIVKETPKASRDNFHSILFNGYLE